MENLTVKNYNSNILRISGILFLFLSLFQIGYSNSDFRFVAEIKKDFDFIEVDAFGNLYVVNDYSLVKYNKDGIEQASYKSFNQGAINQVDVSNPLKTIVFHKDMQQLVVLDVSLSVLSEISLNNLDLLAVEKVAYLRDDAIWVYDAGLNQVLKINRGGEILLSSDVLTNLFDFAVFPRSLKVYENKIYLLNSDGKVLLFDAFATYIEETFTTSAFDIQLLDQKLVLFESPNLVIHDLRQIGSTKIDLSSIASSNRVLATKDHIYVADNSSIRIYVW